VAKYVPNEPYESIALEDTEYYPPPDCDCPAVWYDDHWVYYYRDHWVYWVAGYWYWYPHFYVHYRDGYAYVYTWHGGPPHPPPPVVLARGHHWRAARAGSVGASVSRFPPRG